MFPLTSNEAYIKSTGERSTLGSMLENGGSGEIPIATDSTLGGIKIGTGLSVAADGTASVSDPFASYGAYRNLVAGYAVFKPSTTENKYKVGLFNGEVTSTTTRTFGTTDYGLSDCFLPDVFSITEFYNYLTDAVIEGLDLDLLYDGLSEAAESATLSHAITDYDVLVLQGCYSSTQTSEYNTTMFYVNPDITKTYWFGVKDRNASYSGTLSFTDATHVALSASRRIKIYGIKL